MNVGLITNKIYTQDEITELHLIQIKLTEATAVYKLGRVYYIFRRDREGLRFYKAGGLTRVVK